MKLYLTRHGETEVNARHQVSGQSEAKLTEKGRAQAQALAQRALQYPIDLIVASPLERAWQTGQAVADALHIPMIAEPRLKEMDFGFFDQVDIDDPDFRVVKRQFSVHMGGGETVLQVAARVYAALWDIKANYPDKTVLIVCHGTVSRLVHSYFTQLPDDEAFWNSIPANCELREYEW